MTSVINRPVEEVFEFAADERNEPRYNRYMRRAEQITDGPKGVGTRFRAEIRSIGRTIPMVTEITAYERPHRYASSTHLPIMDTKGTVTFDSVPGGTRMRWSWEVDPRGAFKLLTPLLASIGRRQERANWAALKGLLEEAENAAGVRRSGASAGDGGTVSWK